MNETTAQLEQAIEQVTSQYYRLVILTGAPASGKTAALQSLAEKLGCQLVNVNLELSKRMLELTRTQRSRQVERLLKEEIAAVPGDVVLLDNLEILFDTALQLQPLRLLQVLNRNSSTIVRFTERQFSGRVVDLRRTGLSTEFVQDQATRCRRHHDR